MPRVSRAVIGLPTDLTQIDLDPTSITGTGILGSLGVTSQGDDAYAILGDNTPEGDAGSFVPIINITGIGASGSGAVVGNLASLMFDPGNNAATGAIGSLAYIINPTAQSVAGIGAIFPLPITLSVAGKGVIGSVMAKRVVVITTPATTTWTTPSGVTNLIQVETWGSGGQGGNAWGLPQGGGGGAYASISNLTVIASTSYNIQIGVGGASTSSTLFSGGVDGTATWFKDAGTVFADFGRGGANSRGSPLGAGGLASASIGTTKYDGGSGGISPSGTGAGAGGGAAGPDGAGATATSGNGQVGNGGAGDNGSGGAGGTGANGTGPQIAQNGGSAQNGGGGGGGAESDNDVGTGGVGGLPGGGGGGSNGNTVADPGYGANGQIRISY